jgi:hypothetical protein
MQQKGAGTEPQAWSGKGKSAQGTVRCIAHCKRGSSVTGSKSCGAVLTSCANMRLPCSAWLRSVRRCSTRHACANACRKGMQQRSSMHNAWCASTISALPHLDLGFGGYQTLGSNSQVQAVRLPAVEHDISVAPYALVPLQPHTATQVNQLLLLPQPVPAAASLGLRAQRSARGDTATQLTR